MGAILDWAKRILGDGWGSDLGETVKPVRSDGDDPLMGPQLLFEEAWSRKPTRLAGRPFLSRSDFVQIVQAMQGENMQYAEWTVERHVAPLRDAGLLYDVRDGYAIIVAKWVERFPDANIS